MGRPASGKWRAEPRSEPDSGHPTVRDRRGALGDVTHGEPRNPTRKSKERLWSLLAYRCARPGSIPTTRTSGSVGGQGQQRPWSTRPIGMSCISASAFMLVHLRVTDDASAAPPVWSDPDQSMKQGLDAEYGLPVGEMKTRVVGCASRARPRWSRSRSQANVPIGMVRIPHSVFGV